MHPADERAQLDVRWDALVRWLGERFGRTPGLEGVLFMIGLHGRGMGYEPDLPGKRKQDLVMEGGYRALAHAGLYTESRDENGRPFWRRTTPPSRLPIDEQEDLLREGALRYFAALGLFPGGPDGTLLSPPTESETSP